MILAVDVDYQEASAFAAAVSFSNWESEEPERVYVSRLSDIAEYEPGAFYKRELPCILTLLDEHQLTPEVIIIDGFVTLGESGRPGLGAHLYQSLDGLVPIIGVAKKPFKDTMKETEVLRGESSKPLYVTTRGMALEKAKAYVLCMHGKYRIPTLLKRVDRECRGAVKSWGTSE